MSEATKAVITAAVNNDKEGVLNAVRSLMDAKAAEVIRTAGYEQKDR